MVAPVDSCDRLDVCFCHTFRCRCRGADSDAAAGAAAAGTDDADDDSTDDDAGGDGCGDRLPDDEDDAGCCGDGEAAAAAAVGDEDDIAGGLRLLSDLLIASFVAGQRNPDRGWVVDCAVSRTVAVSLIWPSEACLFRYSLSYRCGMVKQIRTLCLRSFEEHDK